MAIGNSGSNSIYRHETPKKDRHAMLEDYRVQQQQQQQHKRSRECSPSSCDYLLPQNNTTTTTTTSVARPIIPVQQSVVTAAMPPLSRSNPPPSSSNTFITEGTTALDRFRLRKQQKLQQMQMPSYYNNDNETINSSYYEIDEPTVSFTSSVNVPIQNHSSTVATSKNSRRQSILCTGAARPPTAARYNQNATLSQESMNHPPCHSQETTEVSQLSQESVGVESMARYEEMQRRLRKLEEEKVGITISMAPIMAQHREKEDAWTKEQSRLLQEIESLKHVSQMDNERFRDLQAQYEAKDDENRQLRLQVRKESSVLYNNSTSGGDSGAWSRYLQVERDVTDLKEKLQCAEEEIRASRLDRVSVEKELHATKIELDSIVRAYEELQEEYDHISKSSSDERDAQIKLEVLTTEHIATSAQLNAVCSDMAATKATFKAKIDALEQQHHVELEKYQFEISVLKTRAAAMENDRSVNRLNNNQSLHNAEVIEDYAILKARIEERDRKIAEFDKERQAWETLRRQMHNRIQELRGNIRVFVRTRPFLPNDDNEVQSAIEVSPDGESLSIFDARTVTPYNFTFDKVFSQSSGQDHVFDEVSDFVQSAMDGYHVCLFSYGQTGSGKTHTMQGSGNGAMRGIIPRAVEQILYQATEMVQQKWKFTLSASFLEIYNEELKDLLHDMSYNPSSQNTTKLAIKRSREGKSYVEGLTEIHIDSTDPTNGMQKLQTLMNVAARARSVASTKMNAVSSRSHSVFMLKLQGYNEDSGAEVHGALNLCDLAGSERLDRSGANSDMKRLKETQAINKSLSSLGDVFNALAQKSSHVPYRNSKLTYLLQDCLSGDGKALMFVNLSPTNLSSNESLCSLRFAQRVNQVELGKATKHIQYNRV